MSDVITFLPGKYRVHFDSFRAELWFDVEIKRGHPRAFVRAVGPQMEGAITSPFLKRTVYLDSIAVGCQMQFHGKFMNMIHKIKAIERLAT